MINGQDQTIVIEGELAGPLEMLIGNHDTATTDVIFTFKNHNTGTVGDPTEKNVMYSELTAVFGAHNTHTTTTNQDQIRLFVYSKHGRYDICSDCDGTKLCLSDPAVNVATTDQNGLAPSATEGQQYYFGVQNDTPGPTIFMADEDYVNTGLGDDTVVGNGNFNIIEDHGGDDTVTAYGAGNDNILISRSGGDSYSSTTGASDGSQVNEYWIYPTH